MKIVVDIPAYEPGLAAIRALGKIEVDLLGFEGEEAPAREIAAERIRNAEVLFTTFAPLNHQVMKTLRWIQVGSTGYKQLFGLGLTERGVRATNGRGCFDVPIAEWNIAMMVNLARNLRQMVRNQDGAVWDRGAAFQSEIRGLTVGLWGYGGIGRETARLCRQMGLKVHVLTRRGVGPRRDIYTVAGTGDPEGVMPDRNFVAGQEMEFLRDLDFLVLGMPLTSVTDGMIGEKELQALPRRAFVLNPARGPIIREAALVRALREGWIAGAALDTHYHYPLPPDHPLWRQPNVILTPHIAGSGLSPHYLERLWDLFVQNLERYLHQRPLMNELTPAELSGA